MPRVGLQPVASPSRPFHVETWPLARLNAYPRNAREHSPEQVRQIAESVRAFGWTTPLLVTPEGTLIAGHGRLEAAKLLGMTEVPVVILADLSEQQQRLLRLADNRLALGATWNAETLAAELQELQLEGADLQLTAFDAAELEAFFPAAPAAADGLTLPEGLRYQVIVACADEQTQCALLDRFAAEGMECRALIS